ncbi:MAG TPA: FkbM family methyltransferase [Chthoniobacterales bacterium]
MNQFVTYAQNFEDVILWRALKDVTNGFYIDVGANSPLNDSVTRAFYERGWRGINIEADVEWLAQLQSERARDINIHAFASNKSGLTAFFHIPKEPGLSTFDPLIAENHRAAGYELDERIVPTVTLNEVLELHRVETIHFLKIDVEGAEKVVIEGIDLAKYRPWIILVESTLPNSQTPSHQSFDNLLSEADYKFCYFDGLNRFYVCIEQFDALAELIALPPNPFDCFTRAEEASLREHFDNAVRQIQERDRKANEVAADYRRLSEERDRLKEVSLNVSRERDDALRESGELKAEYAEAKKNTAALRDSALQTAIQLKAEWDTLRQAADQLEVEKSAAYAEVEQVRTKVNQFEETLRELVAERSTRAAFTDQLNVLCREHLNKQGRSNSSKKIRTYYQGILDGVTAAYRKHFGKKRLKLNDPEPRHNWFKRTLRSLFRKQGSVNKGLISSLRNQIAWNKAVASRLDTIEAFCLELSKTMAATSHGHRSSQGMTGSEIPKAKHVSAADEKKLEGPSRLSASAKAVYKSLERAGVPFNSYQNK